MIKLRRRPLVATTAVEAEPLAPKPKPLDPRTSKTCRVATYAVACVITVIVAFVLYSKISRRRRLPRHNNRPLLRSGAVASDDETSISAGSLPLEDSVPPGFREKALACMPTVARRDQNRTIEYVSNAVKSWRLATNASTDMRRLFVFDMDVGAQRAENPRAPLWLQAVFKDPAPSGDAPLPSWLELLSRESDAVPAPRGLTLGDSEQRVLWRSKEALDYAELLRRCAARAEGPYVVVVQDDVLFREHMAEVVNWCDQNMTDKLLINEETGRRKTVRVCSASLFDIPGPFADVDGHKLSSSNMVARIWHVKRAAAMHKYITANFDGAPVDWLADRLCRRQRRQTIVMEPNPVRHRGVVSSFSENKREGLLT